MKRVFVLFQVAILLLLTACSGATSGEKVASVDSWQEQYDLGIRYLSEGNYEEAIIAFTAAIEIDPKQASAYVGRGDAYVGSAADENAVELQEEHYTNAINDYLYSLELDDQQTEVYLKAADAYLSQGKEEDALAILERGYDATGGVALLEKIHQMGSFAGEEPVVWTDPVLERMIRDKIGKTEGEVLVQDLDDISALTILGDTHIFLNTRKIDSFRNCRFLDDSGDLTLTAYYRVDDQEYTERGEITNIDSLQFFRNLESVSIIANHITDISVLQKMKLNGAFFWANDISDLSYLAYVSNENSDDAQQHEQFIEIGAHLPDLTDE